MAPAAASRHWVATCSTFIQGRSVPPAHRDPSSAQRPGAHPPNASRGAAPHRRVRAHAALGARCAPVMILRGASASWCHPRPGVAAAGLGSFGESATPQRRFSPMRQICAGFGSQSILFVGHVKLPYARASGANPLCCGDCCFRGGSINETRLLRIATTAEECVVQAMARLGSRGSRTSNRSRKELWRIQL